MEFPNKSLMTRLENKFSCYRIEELQKITQCKITFRFSTMSENYRLISFMTLEMIQTFYLKQIIIFHFLIYHNLQKVTVDLISIKFAYNQADYTTFT